MPWLSRDGPECRTIIQSRRTCGGVTLIYKKGSKEDPGNYNLVSLTSVPGKIMEHILLDDMLDHMRNERVI